jgi:signal transduction histidine kinase
MSGLDSGETTTSWRSILDALPFPTLLIEPGTGRVLLANGAAGLLPDEAAGDEASYATGPDGERIAPDQWPRRRASRGERLDGMPITWHTPGGQASFLSYADTVLVDGRPLTVLTYLDVTRQAATEEELRQAVRVRDEFFSFASHELKDPLASLMLSVEVLRRVVGRQGAVPEDLLRERLDVCKRQGERLAGIIENLLDVSRIAHGRLRPDLEALDLCDLVRDVVERFQEQARAAGSALELGPCGPTIGYFDRSQVEHVLGNLVSNAIKYGEGRPVSVRLVADASTARIEVEDRGIGIAEADQARVFDRFERATRDHRGTSLGLGLYIVRSIVEAHGGSIALRSEPGRGSTFTVELPRKRLPRHDPAVAPPGEGQEG